MTDGALASDVQLIVQTVDIWASERPIVREAVLFGDRMKSIASPSPIELAVRFDDRRMLDGFDDWIEQLRTNFADLAAAVGTAVSVVTPDMRQAWTTITDGAANPVFVLGKVSVVTEPRPLMAANHAATANHRAPTVRTVLSALLQPVWTSHLEPGRRPTV